MRSIQKLCLGSLGSLVLFSASLSAERISPVAEPEAGVSEEGVEELLPTYEELEEALRVQTRKSQILEMVLRREVSLGELSPKSTKLLRSIGIQSESFEWYQRLPGNL